MGVKSSDKLAPLILIHVLSLDSLSTFALWKSSVNSKACKLFPSTQNGKKKDDLLVNSSTHTFPFPWGYHDIPLKAKLEVDVEDLLKILYL